VLAGEDWPLDSPFLRAAREELGHDPEGARAWATRTPIWDDLAPGGGLAAALPVFASGSGDSTSAQTDFWIGHNHWAADRASEAVPIGDRLDWAVTRLQADTTADSPTTRLGAAAALAVLGFGTDERRTT
jgi:hypothetical protein